jgi:2-oxoacid:acceptor oxidoreductase gamma subunit (pyruvate/2-ketoisovalerate family)/2-oxoacid:acceptor oxidoreductase delta subunit (pyruvate/2-ketoisovalerate family)
MGIEIRLHGRGGQGGVTCAKILAAVHARLGKSVQTFGDYAGERSGAPVRAYTRVADQPITNRNKVYRPDQVLVLDPTLLGAAAVAGLAPGGALLVNSPEPVERLGERFPRFRVAAVDATAIARRHGIGTRTVVIVNTTIAGAYARMLELPFAALEECYRTLGLLSNLEAAREAWAAVAVREATSFEAATEAAPAAVAPVPALTEVEESLATGLETGSWRSQRPRYRQPREALAPCSAWCPAGNDVLGFIQELARGGELAGAKVLRQTQPLASVCGRVCPAPCMEGCNRAEYDGAVNIRALERWIGDRAPMVAPVIPQLERRRRVAIVGGGPAGLAAAHELVRAGHRATIFDAENELGGVLRTGIPAYRLPREPLDREIAAIVALGVETRLGARLDHERLARLPAEYDGVVIATGLQRSRGLDVPGVDLPGIKQGIDYLRRYNLLGGALATGHVVVLGGGNTAIDCARSALRNCAERVTLAYRRSQAEMPAIREEIEEARREGVEIVVLRAPVGFEGRGRVEAVLLAEVELGEPDASGRRRPVVTDRVERLACDAVLLALGQSADLGLLPAEWRLEAGRIYDGMIPLAVVAAGDVSTGEGTVTHAIGDGRRAAGRLLAAMGEEVEVFERPDRAAAVPATDIRFDHFERRPPAADRHLMVEARFDALAEVSLGPEDYREAARCFSCGSCTRCDTCLVYCPEGIIRRHVPTSRVQREADYEVDYSFCKGCGICVVECPRSAMEMVEEWQAN